MNNDICIYLAGAMTNCLSYSNMNEWRVELKKLLMESAENCGVKVKVINPVAYYNFMSPRHHSEKEIMQFDLNYIRKSDIVIVNLDGLNTSIGTCIELYEAMKNNIPVLAFGEIEIYANLHPWIKECITRVDWNKEELVEYIKDFYFT